MNTSEKYKFLLALLMILATFGWAVFSVNLTMLAIAKLQTANIVAAAGADTCLGSLLTLLALVYQHYFRKAKPE